MTFQDLHLQPALLRAVGAVGYTQPTPIQAAAIGPILRGKDLIGCAQTGTGKTGSQRRGSESTGKRGGRKDGGR